MGTLRERFMDSDFGHAAMHVLDRFLLPGHQHHQTHLTEDALSAAGPETEPMVHHLDDNTVSAFVLAHPTKSKAQALEARF